MSTQPLTRGNPQSWLSTIWDALGGYRENCIPESEGDPIYDALWDDICTAMAWISEELGIDSAESESMHSILDLLRRLAHPLNEAELHIAQQEAKDLISQFNGDNP